MNFIRQREKHNGRLQVKAEAHRGWLQGISRTLFVGAQQNLAALGVWPIEFTKFPEFREL